MCSVAASVVSRQYMHHSPSRSSQRPTCRKPSSRTSIGIRSLSAGNRGSVASAASSTMLAAHGQPAQRRHRREGRESAAGEVGTFPAPDVLDRLRTAQRRKAGVGGDGALPHQHAKARDCADMTHGFVVAQLVLAPEETRGSAGRRVARDPAGVSAEMCQKKVSPKSPSRPASAREASVR